MPDDGTYILADDMQVLCTATGVDKHGHPSGSFDSPPAWSSSDPKLFSTDDVSQDGLQCQVRAQGEIGTGQLSVRGTSGGKELVKVQAVEIVAGAAVSIGIAAGTPEPVGTGDHVQPVSATPAKK